MYLDLFTNITCNFRVIVTVKISFIPTAKVTDRKKVEIMIMW